MNLTPDFSRFIGKSAPDEKSSTFQAIQAEAKRFGLKTMLFEATQGPSARGSRADHGERVEVVTKKGEIRSIHVLPQGGAGQKIFP